MYGQITKLPTAIAADRSARPCFRDWLFEHRDRRDPVGFVALTEFEFFQEKRWLGVPTPEPVPIELYPDECSTVEEWRAYEEYRNECLARSIPVPQPIDEMVEPPPMSRPVYSPDRADKYRDEVDAWHEYCRARTCPENPKSWEELLDYMEGCFADQGAVDAMYEAWCEYQVTA